MPKTAMRTYPVVVCPHLALYTHLVACTATLNKDPNKHKLLTKIIPPVD